MVHHGDVEKALRNMKKSMQHECRVISKKEFFKKPSDKKREVKIALQRKLKRIHN
ncbi:MAG: 30S ribosomal protein S21 [Rickettsiaceae bacterium H1]|nr:30S ribosomal protein S21 [Rickettsiaceae bacterium H1]